MGPLFHALSLQSPAVGPLHRTRLLLLDLGSQLLLSLVPTICATWSLGFPLTNDRSLEGTVIDLQLLALTTSATLVASNGLELSLDL